MGLQDVRERMVLVVHEDLRGMKVFEVSREMEDPRGKMARMVQQVVEVLVVRMATLELRDL
jgi:hypothetical protein